MINVKNLNLKTLNEDFKNRMKLFVAVKALVFFWELFAVQRGSYVTAAMIGWNTITHSGVNSFIKI